MDNVEPRAGMHMLGKKEQIKHHTRPTGRQAGISYSALTHRGGMKTTKDAGCRARPLHCAATTLYARLLFVLLPGCCWAYPAFSV